MVLQFVVMFSVRRVVGCARNRQDRKGTHALGPADEDTLDSGCRRRTGMKAGILLVAEPTAAMRDQVLRQLGDRIDVQVRVAEQNRASLSDGEGRADNGEIDVCQIMGRCDTGQDAVKRDGERELNPRRQQRGEIRRD